MIDVGRTKHPLGTKLLILAWAAACGISCASAQEILSSPDITAGELRHHVQYLASPELKGRNSGDPGNRLAAQYIAGQFKAYGLLPVGDSGGYLQHFGFLANPRSYDSSTLGVTVHVRNTRRSYHLNLESEFRPLYTTTEADTTAPVVFAGYGLRVDEFGYNDYASIDARGKIVIIMRGTPDGPYGRSSYFRWEPLALKLESARQAGAVGALIVIGPLDSEGKQMKPLYWDRGMPSGTTPAMDIAISSVDSILHLFGKDFKAIQTQINNSKHPNSFPLPGVTVRMRIRMGPSTTQTANVAGILRGTDPEYSQEYVVVGAHFDHIGMGGMLSLMPDTTAVHPGADDNGSGTAGLLEVAQYFATHHDQLKRSLLFLAFSGEEEGLRGSSYYVHNPLVPIDKTVAMLNMDMIGRLRGDSLELEGITTSSGWLRIVHSENISPSFILNENPQIDGSSDHWNFIESKIPSMFFFTGLHPNYHRPSDTWEKLNYAGEERVVRYVVRIAGDLTGTDSRLKFTTPSGRIPAPQAPWILTLAELTMFFAWYSLCVHAFINRKRRKI